ncbi:hypothetical protein GCM10010094_43340 [Streptomyces flaveus]|uniref:Uncharacterized protein n=1 Tax=Streptomyces flaveus TaxID=66370 RepID=A0A917VGH3_9ACTN|nr:hypothetical protein GCM10010094_43340 [Streptomyces flaveus]
MTRVPPAGIVAAGHAVETAWTAWTAWEERVSPTSQPLYDRLGGRLRDADTNTATNVAAGQGGIPRRSAGAGVATAATGRASAREPQPARVGIPLSGGGGCQLVTIAYESGLVSPGLPAGRTLSR